MKELTGYKVLSKYRDSVIISRVNAHEFKSVHYPINKEVKPHYGAGPLCVFKTFKAASNFEKTNTYFESLIVKCHYKRSLHKCVWVNGKETVSYACLPKGTMLADSVTCLE